MTSINWDKPYGERIGLCGPGKYSQDGKQFDVNGNEYPPPVEPKPEKKPEPEISEAVEDETPLEGFVKILLAKGLTHTQIGKELSITRQKVTGIANQLSK